MNVSHIKWVLVAAVLVIMLPWFAVTYSREHSSKQAIELYTPFSQPRFQLRFNKSIRWDPQSFLGRGRDNGYWDWSEKGVVLTPKGENMFADDGKQIFGDMVVGKREITTIKSVQPRANQRDVLFIYRWTEMSGGVKLMTNPPPLGREYQAVATLSEKAGAWEVTSLSDPEYTHIFDILMAETKK